MLLVFNFGARQFFEDLAQCVGVSREIRQQANIRVFKKIWRVHFIPVAETALAAAAVHELPTELSPQCPA